MLEQVDALPCSKARRAIDHGNGKLHLGERSAQMGGHVIWPLIAMVVSIRILRCDPREIGFQVASGRRGRIFLDEQRGRRMLAKDRQQTFDYGGILYPAPDRPSHLMQALSGRIDCQHRRFLPHTFLRAEVQLSRSRENCGAASGAIQGSRLMVQFSYCGTRPDASSKLATGSSTSTPVRLAKRDPQAGQ